MAEPPSVLTQTPAFSRVGYSLRMLRMVSINRVAGKVGRKARWLPAAQKKTGSAGLPVL